MNNALGINEGAKDTLLKAMAKPLFIKTGQTQRTVGVLEQEGGQNEDRVLMDKPPLLGSYTTISNNYIYC